MDEPLRARADYFDLMGANGAARTYRTALEAGVIDALADGPLRADAVARAAGLLEGPTRLLLDVLGAVGLVADRDGAFGLTPLATMLRAGAYRTLGDAYWDHLGAYLKTGQPLITMDAKAQSEGFYRSQAAALAWMLAPAAETAADLLAPDLMDRDAAILDVGAGAAGWSLALARRIPHAVVTALDWPAVLAVAVASAVSQGLEARFRPLAGDFHHVPLPAAAFDLALLANVAHLDTADGNRGLLTRLRHALKPGGRVAILDVFPGQAEGDLNRTLYALGLALRTQGGTVHTRAALEAVLMRAGFRPERFLPLPVPPHTMAALVAVRGG